jgi:hypothetical protein
MDAEDLIQLFLPHQAARLIAGTKEPAMIEVLISDALESGLIAVTVYATSGYMSGPFPASEEIQAGFGLVDYTSQRVAKELGEAAASGATSSLIHALRENLLRRVDKAKLQIHRAELARWIRHLDISSAYQFDQQRPAASPAAQTGGSQASSRVDDVTPEEMREPMRRLKALRSLGGKVRGTPGRWTFDGIVKLEQQEKGRPRSSQKTLRKDLEQAADWEHEQKRGGAVFNGLSTD